MDALLALTLTLGVSDLHYRAALADRGRINFRRFNGTWQCERWEAGGVDMLERLELYGTDDLRNFRMILDGDQSRGPDNKVHTRFIQPKDARANAIDVQFAGSDQRFKAIYSLTEDRLVIAYSVRNFFVMFSPRGGEHKASPARPTTFDPREKLGEGNGVVVLFVFRKVR